MKELVHHIPFQQYVPEELSPADRELLDAAREGCETSYAPFSGFHVGAAGRLSNGEIVCTSNQESEVLPSGMCAERILLYLVQAQYPGLTLDAVAIAAEDGNQGPTVREVTPCGACAQVFIDTEKRQNSPIRIIMAGSQSCSVIDSARRLLPFAFELKK